MTRTGMLLGCCTVVVAACHGGTLTTADATTTDSALQATQCNYGGANDCFATFDACTAAANADVAACRTALQACLPPPPQHGGMQGGCPGGDGDHGGMRGPPPPRPDGGPDGQRPPPPIDSAAADACRSALETCLAGNPSDPHTCFDTAHQCVEDAFRADFQARCDEAQTSCAGSTDEACTRLLQRCAQGVEQRPVNPDGGVACQ